MNEREFEERFARMLDRFDDMYDQEENYLRNVEIIQEQMPEATEAEKMMFLQDSISRERTNNLIRVALKEFLLNK
ncbi:hypothetical protein [Enterococcus sp. DIV0996a]|uniref:hypothetical protein n=1 Tax=unclassified Enterococcus TaxID=2608891 RepID=UPI003F25FE4B